VLNSDLRFNNYLEFWIQEKYQLRLKVLEDGLRGPSSGSGRPPMEGKSMSNGPSRRLSLGGADNMSRVSPNGVFARRSPSFNSRTSTSSSLILKHAKGTSRSFDGGTRSLDRGKILGHGPHSLNRSTDVVKDCETTDNWKGNAEEKSSETTNSDSSDMVSGVLYDMLQKEVVSLRKACHEKDQSLKDKDDAIEVCCSGTLYFLEGHTLVFASVSDTGGPCFSMKFEVLMLNSGLYFPSMANRKLSLSSTLISVLLVLECK
jgi:hypothetical protein